jgi:dimethylhistidine N-methyltransferase
MNPEILRGLSAIHKHIPPKFLYDERGSEIFEQICTLDEYYPVHAELEILKNHAEEMAGWLGEKVILIEPGCGNCRKVQFLLENLVAPLAYVALDISGDFLKKTASALQDKFPHIPIYPVVSDYTKGLTIPRALANSSRKKAIFFPGSTIGNLHPHEAKKLLSEMAKVVQQGGGLLIGVDLKKDASTLERAYDDSLGVTAEFNYNLIDRLNREFHAGLDREHFRYVATYNSQKGRVEMFLRSLIPQTIQLGKQSITLKKGELIHTENSYKYTPEEFIHLAGKSGFDFQTRWTDEQNRFCVYYFECK